VSTNIENARSQVESEIRLLEEFRNELKWLDRGLKGVKTRVVARGKTVKEEGELVKKRALTALQRLRDAKFQELLKKHGITLPSETDITKNYK